MRPLQLYDNIFSSHAGNGGIMVARRSHFLTRQCLEEPRVRTACVRDRPEKTGSAGEAEIYSDVCRYVLAEGLSDSCR